MNPLTDSEHEQILAQISPCGLDCGRCMQNPASPISRMAADLRQNLGNFQNYAPVFSRGEPIFDDYPQFQALLERLAKGACRGCRVDKPCLPTCRIPDCTRERGLDFCADCADFPCEESGLTGMLLERWQQRMAKLQAMGLRDFAAWLHGQPRYP